MRKSTWRAPAVFLALALAPSWGRAFEHPGIFNNKAELDFIKQRIQANAQPWKNAYDKLSSSRYASLSYKASPQTTVECGRYSSPNNGCTEELDDAYAVYAHALLWYFTGNAAHAKKSMEIMDAWAATLKHHTLANATLQAGWSISVMMRGAEIIRHSDAGWPQDGVDRFSSMLRNVYIPDLTQTQGGVDGLISIFGNWALTIIEGLTAMGVFLDDQALFDKALGMWRERVPAYIYVAADGPSPVNPPDAKAATQSQLIAYWFGQQTYKDGVSEETCRDIVHFEYGLAAAAGVAEIALKQGVDLYREQQARFVATLEFHAPFVTGTAAPSWLCKGKFTRPDAIDTWEIAYNHFHNRLGLELPLTKALIAKIRPTSTNKHMAWESMTHAELGTHGLPLAAPARGRAPQGRGKKIGVTFDPGGFPQVMISETSAGGRSWTLEGAALPVIP
jgi:hypothetical protein